MKSSPERRLARKLSSCFAFLTILLALALTFFLTACGGVNASTASQPGTTAPAGKTNLSIAPATINFGTVQLNKVVSSTFSLTNVGPSPETIESATIVPSPTFSLHGWTGAVTLKPGQKVQLQATFTPTIAGNFSGTILVTMSGAPVEYISSSETHGSSWPVRVPGQISIPVTATASAENGPPPVVGISVAPTSLAVQSGQSQQFTSAVTGTSNTAVTWVAALGSISSSGLYKAPVVTSQTTDTVSVISVADPSEYVKAPITVSPGSGGGGGVGPYSLTNQQPVTPVPYSSNPESIFYKKLPADVLSHLWGNTSSVTASNNFGKCIATECGNISLNGIGNTESCNNGACSGWDLLTFASYGNFGTKAVYYATQADPWYIFTKDVPAGNCFYCPAGWTSGPFHMPANALIPGSNSTGQGGDANITVWDQAQGSVVEMYTSMPSSTGKQYIGACPSASHAGTEADPCVIGATQLWNAGSVVSDFYGSRDWGSVNPQGLQNTVSSLGIAPSTAYLRVNEIVSGTIPHALEDVAYCINSSNGDNLVVFPGTAFGPRPCSTVGAQSTYRPYEGMFHFLDYTDAQLGCLDPAKPVCQYSDGTDIPKVQPFQMVFLNQLAHYGAYVGETGGPNSSLRSYQMDDYGVNWAYIGDDYGSPIWAWLDNIVATAPNPDSYVLSGPNGSINPSQKHYSLYAFTNIPYLRGLSGATDQSGNSCSTGRGCDLSGHLQVADQCVAIAQAGLSSYNGVAACP
jgi:hypothetical protein